MLRRQLYRIFITILLIPALIVGAYLLIYNYGLIYSHHSDMLKSDNLRVRSIIYDVTTSLTNICEIVASDQALHDVFSTSYSRKRDAQAELVDFTLLKDLYMRYSEVASIRLFTDNTSMVSYGHVVVINDEQASWFREASKIPGYHWESNTYEDRFGNQYSELQVRHPINVSGSDYSALLVISVSRNYLKNRIDNNSLHVDVSVNREPLFFSTLGNENTNIHLQGHDLVGFYSYSGVDMYNDSRVLLDVSAMKPLKSSDFIYIFSIDTMALFRLERLLSTELLIIAISILVPMIIIVIYTRQLTRRVTTLRTEMHRVTDGDYNIIEHFKGNDELADLFHDLQRMIHAIKERDQKIYEISLEEERLTSHQKAIEFQLLSSKINPHFLYNTLETIRMKAFNSGNKSVANAVKLLGQYMRYNLESSGEFKSLAEELRFMRIYLDIQHLRFGERIGYHIDVHEDVNADALFILPLLIQPLVENALLHGHDQTMEKGMIWIRCFIDEQRLHIAVEDNGRGMTESVLAKLLEKIDMSQLNDTKSFGLHNIQQRLLLLYGEESTLVFKTELHLGTCVSFSIPLSSMERK